MIYLVLLILGVETVFFFAIGIALKVQRNNSDKLRVFVKRVKNQEDLSPDEWSEVASQVLKETYP